MSFAFDLSKFNINMKCSLLVIGLRSYFIIAILRRLFYWTESLEVEKVAL